MPHRPTPFALVLLVALAAACGGHGAAIATHAARTTAHRARATAELAEPLRLAAVLPRRVLRVPILMYHRIDTIRASLAPITQRLTVDPRAFAQQMAFLVRRGFHAITQRQLFEALMTGAKLPPRPVLITFDDGYRDVLGKAAPVLHRLHMPATAYVISGRVSGPDPSFLTWGELRALERDGVAIGSHTVSHRDLPSLTDAQAMRELAGAKRALERHLGVPVPWFAYPAGREDPRIIRLTRAAGYVLAVTTSPGSAQHADDPLRLHRYEILDSTSLATLAAYVSPSPSR